MSPATYVDGFPRDASWNARACSLLQGLATDLRRDSVGSISCSIYDTAWVSMVGRKTDGEYQWLFPESFQHLLDNQLSNGGWASYASTGDGILNSCAALLALKKHEKEAALSDPTSLSDILMRSSKAKTYLESLLQSWNVELETRVGFELLVPAMLATLETEGITCAFPEKSTLRSLQEAKLKRFHPEILYSKGRELTLLHSLEALIGKIDFDRLQSYTTFGSMMASPASSAAYLAQCSIWNEETEAYLRRVIRDGSGRGSGAVPSVYPIPIFELVWIISTLLQAGYQVADFHTEDIKTTISYLETLFINQNDICGFAPGILEDADDSAKAILALTLLGRTPSCKRLLGHFQSSNNHIQTYVGERNASFSANCNVLKATLMCEDPFQYQNQIEHIATYLCDAWWNEKVTDKWNISPYYSAMLFTDAMLCFLEKYDSSTLDRPPQRLLQYRIPVVLIQILLQILTDQNKDGGWGKEGHPEVTSYAILTLNALSSFPWTDWVVEDLSSAIAKGRGYLVRKLNEWHKPQYLWIEKVTYASPRLSEAYCLAALKARPSSYKWSTQYLESTILLKTQASKLFTFFLNLPIFQSMPNWCLKLSVMEGFLFVPELKTFGTGILPHRNDMKNEYLSYIPSTWIVINNHRKLFFEPQFLWNMMVLTVFNFRIDEHVETELASLDEGQLLSVEAMISFLCTLENKEQSRMRNLSDGVSSRTPHELASNGHDSSQQNTEHSDASHLRSHRVLKLYIEGMMRFEPVQSASLVDRAIFLTQLERFLLSHIRQVKDNRRFSTQNAAATSASVAVFQDPTMSFYEWAYTIGAQSVSALMSFAFLTCLLGASSPGIDCFDTALLKYLAQDLRSHIAVMSRLYNDWGSLNRDLAEGNINSINFPEFSSAFDHLPFGEGLEAKKLKLKSHLLDLARHERMQVDAVAAKLIQELAAGSPRHQRIADGVTLFVEVSKLYADMYVAKDLSNTIGSRSSTEK